MNKFFTISDMATDSGPVPAQFLGNAEKTIRMINRVQMELYNMKPGSRRGTITSGYRSPEYNATLPNAGTRSQHLTASAVDYKNPDFTPKEVANVARTLMERGEIPLGGIGTYKGHTHIDIRGRYVTWNFSPLLLAPLGSTNWWWLYLILVPVFLFLLVYTIRKYRRK
jgi:hypothetical protein